MHSPGPLEKALSRFLVYSEHPYYYMNEISMTSQETADGTLFDSLQREFCPTLDSSLIAALLFDVESDVDGTPVTPTRDQIESLRATLKELSLQANECSGIENSYDMHNALREPTLGRTTPSSFGVDTTYDEANSFTDHSPTSGSSSSSSSMSFSSPLGFLQMVLPDVPFAKLRKALETHDSDDLWDVIAFIVTEEANREMEERGLEQSEGDENDETGWEVVRRNREETGMMKASKKKTTTKSKKFLLADIRQQHHEQDKEHQSSRGTSPSQSAPSSVDCWTWISSLSSRLASLLPPHSPTIFASFLHSPQHATSYDAVRACLASLYKSNDPSDRQATLLINLLDIILPDDDEFDINMRSKFISDAELAVCVTEGQGDRALDLAYLLRDLDGPGMGLQSSPFFQGLTSSHANGAVGISALRPFLPTGPPDIQPPPSLRDQVQPSTKRSPPKTNTHQWQTIPSRVKHTHSVPRHSAFHTPTYSRHVNGNKTSHAGFANHSHAPETESNVSGSRIRMRQAMTKSRQALMDAAIMYQKRNNRNHGGEVAVFYAERAREWKTIAKREALNAAREMVLINSERQGKRDVIDLHGTTVAEALAIAREILNQRADSISSAKPLRIITGRGSHSAGRVSVLKPALRNALTEDGWIVTTWDAGLVVRDRLVVTMIQTIDLSHPLTLLTPIYPSDPPFQTTPHSTHERDGYSVHHMSLGTHTGTHLDAPFHFMESGEHVGQLPIGRVFGEFYIVDLGEMDLKERERIPWDAVASRIPADLKRDTILLIHTSWCSRTYNLNDTDNRAYFAHPYLCPTVAQNLISRGISVVGVDTPSPDETPRTDGSTEGGDGFGFHERFLESGGIIVENLANLGKLIEAMKSEGGKWVVSLVPLNLDGLDGSPIRAFAFRVPG